MSRVAGCVAVLGFCAGCIEVRTPGAWTYAAFTAELGLLACREDRGCGTGFGTAFSSAASCERLLGRQFLGWQWQDLQRGDIAFQPAATASCIDWIDSQRTSCVGAYAPENWSKLASPCLDVFVGQRQVGQPCGTHAHCATLVCLAQGPCQQRRCQPARSEGQVCPAMDGCGRGMHCGADGTCHAYHRPNRGEKCDTDWECAAGLTCMNATCVALRGPGDTCTTWANVQPRCGKGLICDGTQTPNRCSVPAARGGDCGPLHPCASGLVCDASVCQKPAADGEKCSKTRANCTGIDRTCIADSDGSAHCAPLPDIGQACAPKAATTAAGRRCQVDLYCDPATVSCRKQTGHGQPCAGSGECRDGMACRAGQCGDGLAVGDGCDPQRAAACGPGLWCKQGHCAALLAGGGLCGGEGSACAPGLVCSQGVCVLGGGINAMCQSTSQCAHGLVCSALTCQEDPCKPVP